MDGTFFKKNYSFSFFFLVLDIFTSSITASWPQRVCVSQFQLLPQNFLDQLAAYWQAEVALRE